VRMDAAIALPAKWGYAPAAMAKAFSSMADLGTRIMNRLQEQKCGQTVEELQEYLKEPRGRILAVLTPLKIENFVEESEGGVWAIVREA
jgi:hypothetical protein